VVYELGCGTGRTCFWLSTFVKCKVVGIDLLPTFIEKARFVAKRTEQIDLEFLEADMLTVDLSPATVIYLYGTCLQDEILAFLLARFHHLHPSTRVITVSYPLTDYCQGKLFHVIDSFRALFPWGRASVYINERKPDIT